MGKYTDMTDEQLVEIAQAGDHTAEEVLINRYKEVVRSRAHLYFIVGADSEDVMQEGMIGIFKAVHSYKPDRDASFKTFAGLCINRQIITAIKAASRLKHGPLNDSVSLSRPADETGYGESIESALVTSSEENPEELMLIRDMIDSILIEAPKLLSKFELEVWNKYLGGSNYQKIAEDMGKTPKSIDNALQRIKGKINKFITD